MPQISPGSRLGRYSIVSFVGAGGMGEVYAARDELLQRTVGIKILAPHLVRDEEHFARFAQEARAASSLNHPNILTIHDFGDASLTENGTAERTVHYIVMELIDGPTLRTILSGGDYDLKRVLDYLGQVADGLSKAHSSGIVHRDLKPENIIISRDGYAKILDFGLAKLLETPDERRFDTQSPTRPLLTLPGKPVAGTPGYMSPEQVEGKAVDHRSDVFSFGCMLYEGVARRPAFEGGSTIEILHKVLYEEPPPFRLDGRFAGASDLSRIIGRCLAKDPEERYQSMKELGIELRQLRRTLDSGVSSARRYRVVDPARRRSAVALGMVAVVLLSGALGVMLWRRFERSSASLASESLKMTSVPTEKRVTDAAISPDGKYLVYNAQDGERKTLRVRHLDTGSDVEIAARSSDCSCGGLSFSPDGNYIYFLDGTTGPFDLVRIPLLGGEEKRIVGQVRSPISFSPDAKQFAFIRLDSQAWKTKVMISSSDGSRERLVTEVGRPLEIWNVAWSPQGNELVVPLADFREGVQARLRILDAATGTEKRTLPEKWRLVSDLRWVADDLLLFSASKEEERAQIRIVNPRTGVSRAVTNDADHYERITASAGGQIVAAIRVQTNSDLWRVPLTGSPAARRLTWVGATWTASEGENGRIFYSVFANGRWKVHGMDSDGGNSRVLTDGPDDSALSVSPDGQSVVFHSRRAGTRNIWRLDLGTGSMVQVTQGIYQGFPRYSPDGKWIYYSDHAREVGRVPAQGGKAEILTDQRCIMPDVSPDSTRIATWCWKGPRRLMVFPSDPKGSGSVIDLPAGVTPGGAVVRWSRDGRKILYQVDQNGVSNVWQYELARRRHSPVTSFSEGVIYSFDLSRDGKQMILSKGSAETSVVLIPNFRQAIERS